ncbi:MAG: YfhO family protein [Mariniphaga sp.]|nr:YfhO family protein [Mariniphaga sp.]
MKKKEILILFLITIIAFWQIAFLQNGMKWDFVDAFLPSRYFFSESILNNQFPLWNPYLLYGTPIFADLVSVFNPEFWIVGNLFGYSNITLQFMFLVYVFFAGISFFYFLKQFNSEDKISLGLSVAYMLSGLTVGNAQHLAFVAGYAILPFALGSYFKFIRQFNRGNLVQLAISLFLMIFASYPGLTIITGYFLLCIFVYNLIINRAKKNDIKTALIYHSILAGIVVLFSTVLIVAYFQGAPFLSRFGGLTLELAHKHPFSFKSVLSFLLPMSTGADAQFFETDPSMSNGYWGIVSLVLFLFALTKKAWKKESYIVLLFGIFSLLVSFGDRFFLREFLYRHFPLMNMFQYPGIFRAFAIFGFLTFAGINLKINDLTQVDRRRLVIISGLLMIFLLILVGNSVAKVDGFVFFEGDKSFTKKLLNATRFDAVILQGTIQLLILLAFIFSVIKIKNNKHFATVLLILFVSDGIIATQLNIHYTVVGDVNPLNFHRYLKSSPKGFPAPELNPIGENSDRNAQNDFIWMNNNVFPKKVTFDGLVSFKLDGYARLSDNYPELLEVIKKEPIAYFSDDVRDNSTIENFKSNTVFLANEDYQKPEVTNFGSNNNNLLTISSFSPKHIEIETQTQHPQLLVYQQNYFSGWSVFIDGEKQNILKSNFAHMAVLVPPGEHSVRFEYKNPLVIIAFASSYLIFFVLIGFSIFYFIKKNPERKKQLLVIFISGVVLFLSGSFINRYFYQKNKLGLAMEIAEKTKQWQEKYNDISVQVSTQLNELKNSAKADTVFFVDEKTNIAELSRFLMKSESTFFGFGWQNGFISEELFELIYSFYPKIIEQKKIHNSGYLLVEKTEENPQYAVLRDFEPEDSPEWKREPWRIKKNEISGNHSYFYGVNDEWGTTVEISVDKELLNLEKILILADIQFEEEVKEALLVFTTLREGETHLYEISKIDRFAREPGKWYRAAFSVQEPEVQESDLIKIYFWNKNKAQFHIDNLKINFGVSE